MTSKTSLGDTRAGRWLKQGTPDELYFVFTPHALLPQPPIRFDHKLQDFGTERNS